MFRCSSQVGMSGDEQKIKLANGCMTKGTTCLISWEIIDLNEQFLRINAELVDILWFKLVTFGNQLQI